MPLQQLRDSGLAVSYLDEGSGPTVLVGHCSSASHKEWLPLIETMKRDWHVLAPDFIGYGRSEAWPADQPFSIAADADILVALAEKSEGPLHIVGHSYGGALALEAARQLRSKVKSLTLVEPVSFHLLRGEQRAEWTEIEHLGAEVLAAMQREDHRAAAGLFMSYWRGRWKWWLSPERFKAAITATMPKVAHEFEAAAEASTRLDDYAAIHAPVLIVLGSRTRAPTRVVGEMLVSALPNSTLASIRGAGHMSPFTHQAEVNALVLDHLAEHR